MIKHIGYALGLGLLLTGCGGGGSSNRAPEQPPPPASLTVTGAGIKGPLVNASVSLYQIDPSAADLKGAMLGQGETDAAAQITNLTMDASAAGYVLLEFTANADTLDLTTGAAPVLDQLVTYAAVDKIVANEPLYATALTTMALEIAAAKAGDDGLFGGDADGSTSEAELMQAIAVAENQVKTSLGFGLLDEVDLFDTAPLLGSDADPSALTDVTNYRTAIELAAAVLTEVQQDAAANGSSASVQEVLTAVAADLSDGAIDGLDGGEAIAMLAEVSDLAGELTQEPSQLNIPGTEMPISDVVTVLVEEIASTGVNVDTTALEDGTISVPSPAPVTLVADSDNDGVTDDIDNCPAASNEAQTNSDQDADGDACDVDDDNDSVADVDDAFPLDPTETLDTDGDGIGNNADIDDDGDSVLDAADAFPLDANESADADADGIGNNADPDDDNDGTADVDDAFPLNPEESADTDGDGVGNNADLDDDNDGVPDAIDGLPTDPAETVDTDGDGIGNNADTDDDGDQVADANDNCPLTANPDQADTDGDGQGDACANSAVWNQTNWDEANWQ